MQVDAGSFVNVVNDGDVPFGRSFSVCGVLPVRAPVCPLSVFGPLVIVWFEPLDQFKVEFKNVLCVTNPRYRHNR